MVAVILMMTVVGIVVGMVGMAGVVVLDVAVAIETMLAAELGEEGKLIITLILSP